MKTFGYKCISTMKLENSKRVNVLQLAHRMYFPTTPPSAEIMLTIFNLQKCTDSDNCSIEN